MGQTKNDSESELKNIKQQKAADENAPEVPTSEVGGFDPRGTPAARNPKGEDSISQSERNTREAGGAGRATQESSGAGRASEGSMELDSESK